VSLLHFRGMAFYFKPPISSGSYGVLFSSEGNGP